MGRNRAVFSALGIRASARWGAKRCYRGFTKTNRVWRVIRHQSADQTHRASFLTALSIAQAEREMVRRVACDSRTGGRIGNRICGFYELRLFNHRCNYPDPGVRQQRGADIWFALRAARAPLAYPALDRASHGASGRPASQAQTGGHGRAAFVLSLLPGHHGTLASVFAVAAALAAGHKTATPGRVLQRCRDSLPAALLRQSLDQLLRLRESWNFRPAAKSELAAAAGGFREPRTSAAGAFVRQSGFPGLRDGGRGSGAQERPRPDGGRAQSERRFALVFARCRVVCGSAFTGLRHHPGGQTYCSYE